MTENYYLILGVPVGASQGQIDLAYRERVQSLQAGRDTSWPLEMIQAAYLALSDPPNRQQLDRSLDNVPISAAPPSAPAAPEPLLPEEGEADLGDVSLTHSFRTFQPSFEEIYARLWSNFEQTTRPKAEEIRSLTIDIPITPEQMMSGGVARVLVPALTECNLCHGQRTVGPYACASCEGRGAVADERPVMVRFPAGQANHAARIPLDRFGIHNFYLTVLFRMTREPIE
jgi:DnaJ-class molecular chaperone